MALTAIYDFSVFNNLQMASESDKSIPVNSDSLKNDREILASKTTDLEKKKEKFQAAVFLTAVTSIAAAVGFGTTVIAARKQDPKYFNEGVTGTKAMTETGASLAMRALGWGTVYAVTGCSLLFYGIWKLSGASNAQEFRTKMGSILPKLSNDNPPQSRTEFEGLNDLLKYVSEDWGKEKAEESK